MKSMPLRQAFTLIEPGPVVLVTTNDGRRNNVMTITWTMARGFDGEFAMMTGAWNHSFAALQRKRECVLAIPTVDMIDIAVGVGTCSGKDVDKFDKFGLTPLKAQHVQAPLIKECLANVECRVVEIINRYSIVVLQGVAAYYDRDRKEKRMIHAVGDGMFIVDGRMIDRKDMMRSKLPSGI